MPAAIPLILAATPALIGAGTTAGATAAGTGLGLGATGASALGAGAAGLSGIGTGLLANKLSQVPGLPKPGLPTLTQTQPTGTPDLSSIFGSGLGGGLSASPSVVPPGGSSGMGVGGGDSGTTFGSGFMGGGGSNDIMSMLPMIFQMMSGGTI